MEQMSSNLCAGKGHDYFEEQGNPVSQPCALAGGPSLSRSPPFIKYPMRQQLMQRHNCLRLVLPRWRRRNLLL